jgi:hypothetical protein
LLVLSCCNNSQETKQNSSELKFRSFLINIVRNNMFEKASVLQGKILAT